MIFGQQNSSVEALINQQTRSWKNEVIDHCFNVAEAAVIKSIPLSSSSQPDKLIWPFTLIGMYSVKSGYRFLSKESNVQPPLSNFSSQGVGWWRQIWSIEVLNKIKNFVWRCSREAIPTRANLCKRKIVPDGVCDKCKSHAEDCSHALFFCSDVQVVWALDPQRQWLLARQGQTAKEIFKYELEEKKDVALLAFTSWALWNGRNQIRTNQNACPLNQIMNTSKECKREFQILNP